MKFFQKPHPRTPKSWNEPYARQGVFPLRKEAREKGRQGPAVEEDRVHTIPAAHTHGAKCQPRGALWWLRAEWLGKLWAALKPFPWRPNKWSETKPGR